MITNAITDVQKRVEGFNFDIRKHLVEYDDVVNKHRDLIYEERNKILSGADLKSNILDMVNDEISNAVAVHCHAQFNDDWDIPALLAEVNTVLPLPRDVTGESIGRMSKKEVEDYFIELAAKTYEQRETEMGPDKMRMLERLVMLQIIDRLWVEHLTAMDEERRQAGWQTLRQVKSADAYKRSGFEKFEELKEAIRHDVARSMFRVRIEQREAPKVESPMSKVVAGTQSQKTPKAAVSGKKVGRNDPCPCGSGKKFKHCCGK